MEKKSPEIVQSANFKETKTTQREGKATIKLSIEDNLNHQETKNVDIQIDHQGMIQNFIGTNPNELLAQTTNGINYNGDCQCKINLTTYELKIKLKLEKKETKYMYLLEIVKQLIHGTNTRNRLKDICK